VRPGSNDLKFYPIEEYTYRYAKSINWEKWVVTWPLYKALSVIVGPSLDDLRRPAFVEAPQLIVVTMAATLQGSLLAAYVLAVRMRKRFGQKKDSVG
jgi:hypothetical protein